MRYQVIMIALLIFLMISNIGKAWFAIVWCQFSYPCNRLQTSLTSFYPHNNTQWLFPWRPFNFWKPLNLSKVLIFRPKHWCFSKIIIVWLIIWLILLFVQSRVNRLGGVPGHILEKQSMRAAWLKKLMF